MQHKVNKVNKLQQKYNPDHGYSLAERLLSEVEESDAEIWFKHNCTQALIAALDGDIAGCVNVWLSGGYASTDSTDATAQLQAKARGMAQALQDVQEHILEIRKRGKDTSENSNESNGEPYTD